MSTLRRESSSKGFKSLSITVCKDTGVRIQGKTCLTWLLTGRHCKKNCKKADEHSEKGSNHCRNSMNHRCRRGNSLSTANVIKLGGSTPKITATPTTNGSEVMQVGSNQPLIYLRAMLITNRFSAIYVDSGPFSRVYVEKLHNHAQSLSIPNHLFKIISAQWETNLRNPPSKPHNRDGYQPKGAQILAQ